MHSSIGVGTTFKIYLPASGEPASAPATPEPLASGPGGGETVLVAEDEDGVRHLVDRLLSRNGYKVLVACSGAEGLDIVRSYNGDIHLLITDVIMPNMSGRELAETLTTIHPGLLTMYMSGYPDQVIRTWSARYRRPLSAEAVHRSESARRSAQSSRPAEPRGSVSSLI